MKNTNLFGLSRISIENELAAAGFIRRRSDRIYTRNGIAFLIEDNWPILQSRLRPVSTDPLLDLMGKCGLWKCVTKEGRVRRLFDIPPKIILNREADAYGCADINSSPFKKMLTWALDTVDGKTPADWTIPSRDEVHSMIPRHGLTVQVGPLVRQGEVIHEERRLALRFRILNGIPEDLPEHRLQWLYRLLIEAQNRWRLVRIGFADGERGSPVQAEVDLTGAPPSMLEKLVAIALPALRFVVRWISTPAVFLANDLENCPALEIILTPPARD